MTPGEHGTVTYDAGRAGFRPADCADALLALERRANLASLGHVFPPAEFAFPAAAVLARWRATLADPTVTVEVVDGPDGLACYAAYDATTLRHLAVDPDRWGDGLARAAVDRAVAAIRAAGGTPRLWCLVENHRARGLYEHLGWHPSGETRDAQWPPHPAELEYVLRGSADG